MYSNKLKDYFGGNGNTSGRGNSITKNSSGDSGIVGSLRSSGSKHNGSDFSQMNASQELFSQSQQSSGSRTQTQQSPALKFYTSYRSMGPAFGKSSNSNSGELNNFCRDIDLSQLRKKERQRDEWDRLNVIHATVNECTDKLDLLKEGLSTAQEVNHNWKAVLQEIDNQMQKSTAKIVETILARDKEQKNDAINKLAKSEATVKQLQLKIKELQSNSHNESRSCKSIRHIFKQDQEATKSVLQQIKTDINAIKRYTSWN